MSNHLLGMGFSIWLLLLSCVSASACDGGCPTVVSFYNGLLPQYQRHFVGLRWRMSRFSTDATYSHINSSTDIQEHLHSFELMGRVFVHPRVQLMAFVPLNYNLQFSSDSKQSLVGLGDISLLGFYNIINTDLKYKDSTAVPKLKHNWLVGGGIKVPTGNFQNIDEMGIAHPLDFQLGTGSVDFVLSSTYSFRFAKWGLQNNLTYKINLANALQYRLGNQTNAQLTAFGMLEHKAWMFVPQGGLQLEHTERNYNGEFVRINSGGTQLLAVAALDIYFKQIQLGLRYEQPLWQNIAKGNIQTLGRLSINFNYLF